MDHSETIEAFQKLLSEIDDSFSILENEKEYIDALLCLAASFQGTLVGQKGKELEKHKDRLSERIAGKSFKESSKILHDYIFKNIENGE